MKRDAVDEPDAIIDMEPEPPSTEPGTIVEFRIAAGTNQGPWNSPDTAVVLYVGQILEIVNDDTIDHQLHAPGDSALDHGGVMTAEGGSDTFEIMRPDALDPGRTSYYDHNIGRPANFWIDARPQP